MEIKDIRGELPVHRTKTMHHRLQPIRYIVIHHTGNIPKRAVQSFAHMAQYHISEFNYPGISYHYAVDTDGSSYLLTKPRVTTYHCNTKRSICRKLWSRHPLNARSYPRPTNENCISVALVGDMDYHKPTDEQYKSAIELVRIIMKEFPDTIIIGHRDVPGCDDVTCPGKYFDLPKFVADVRKKTDIDDLCAPDYVNAYRKLKNEFAQYLPEQHRAKYNTLLKDFSMVVDDWRNLIYGLSEDTHR